MRLISITPSPNKLKKWRATFKDGEKEKHTDFGSKNMDDYTLTGDKDQRDRYRKRHQRDLQTKDYTRAGYLAYYVLWGEHKSMEANALAYKRQFGL